MHFVLQQAEQKSSVKHDVVQKIDSVQECANYHSGCHSENTILYISNRTQTWCFGELSVPGVYIYIVFSYTYIYTQSYTYIYIYIHIVILMNLPTPSSLMKSQWFFGMMLSHCKKLLVGSHYIAIFDGDITLFVDFVG